MNYLTKNKGISGKGLQRIAQGIYGEGFEPYNFKDEIIEGIANMAWWSSWADAWDEAEEDGYIDSDENPIGPGARIDQIAPETPNAAYTWAKGVFDQIDAANSDVDLATFLPPGQSEDDFDAERFGEMLYFEYVGAGRSWADDYEPHGLEIPFGESPHELAYEGDPDLREILDQRNEDFEEEEFDSKQMKLPGVEGKLQRGISGKGLQRIARAIETPQKFPRRRKALKKTAAAYTLELTDEEIKSLGYIADRYEYAAILYDALQQETENGTGVETYSLEEPDAWEFNEVVEAAEEGYMPLMGGPLLEKVQKLLEEIV